MDLTQIRYFLSLAGTLNFTRASEQCNVTQPALTKSIQRLEAELGGPLLLRERNHTQLTPLGTAMLPLLRHTFESAEQARRGAAVFRKQDVARFQIGLGACVEPDVLSPLLGQLNRRCPGVEVTIRQGEPRTLSEWLLASKIDVTLTQTAEQLTDRANSWLVFEDPVVVILPQDHELAERTVIDLDQLRACVLVGRTVAPDAEAAGELCFESLGLSPFAVRHRGATEDHVHALVRGGHGVALSTARRLLPPGLLRRPLAPGRSVAVSVAALAGRPLQRPADLFLRLARARLWDELDPGHAAARC